MGIKDTIRGGAGGTHAATGRQDFPHPVLADRAANYSESSAEYRNLSRADAPLSPEEIMRTRQQSAKARIPIPPSKDWPTEGEVTTYQKVQKQLGI